jgi:hypothetical protein
MGYKTPVPPDWSIPHYQSGVIFIVEAINRLFDSATEALCARSSGLAHSGLGHFILQSWLNYVLLSLFLF